MLAGERIDLPSTFSNTQHQYWCWEYPLGKVLDLLSFLCPGILSFWVINGVFFLSSGSLPRLCEAVMGLLYLFLQNWSRWSELNRQPTVYDTVALPIELHRPDNLSWSEIGELNPRLKLGKLT